MEPPNSLKTQNELTDGIWLILYVIELYNI